MIALLIKQFMSISTEFTYSVVDHSYLYYLSKLNYCDRFDIN